MTPSPADLLIADAVEDDVPALVSLHTAVAETLTRTYGRGHWSHGVTDKGVLRGLRASRVLAARHAGRIIGTLRLATKKPWAIDAAYFTAVPRPLYLLDMAVAPDEQRRGVGRRLLQEAAVVGRAWPAQAIRLDAYDAAAGAGDFYARCGFREVGRATFRGTPLIYFERLL